MRPVIDIRNVHRIFESEAGCAHILHNVSLAVDPGEFVAITGPAWSIRKEQWYDRTLVFESAGVDLRADALK